MIYTGVLERALETERAPADAAARRVSLSVAVLLLNALLMLTPPAIALGALLGALR